MIIRKDGKEYVDFSALFSLRAVEIAREDVEKTAWVALGFPIFWWPLTLVIILVLGAAIALFGG